MAYVADELFGQHVPPRNHPERPERLTIARDALAAAGMMRQGRSIPTRAATFEELARVHDPVFLEKLAQTIPGNAGWLDGDTYYSPHSWTAALAAAGALIDVTRAVMDGTEVRGLAIVRPPGHHATATRAMGFCLLNNVAIAAASARAGGAARVAVLDWDVHHGNGTQDIFWNDPTVMYASVHEYPAYPGTGAAHEIGGPLARGTTINVGLAAGAGDADVVAALDAVIIPRLIAFAPELILVSAGFDTYAADPLGGWRVSAAGLRAIAQRTRRLADAVGGKVVAVLEGGYDQAGLAIGVRQLCEAWLGAPDELTPMAPPDSSTQLAVAATLAALEAS